MTPHPSLPILSRRSFSIAMLTLVSATGLNTAFGAQPPAAAAVEQKQLTTGDGWLISVEYYSQPGMQDAPVIMIVHGENSNALAWKNDYGKTLQELGYAVVIVDLRMHGNSKTTANGQKFDTTDLRPNQYPNMAGFDLEAVKNFLLDEHQKKNLNVRKLGIIASDMSVPIALAFAELDWNKLPYDDAPTAMMRTPRGQDVHAIAMISPIMQLPGVNANVSLRGLTAPMRQIAFFSAYGTQDTATVKQAERLDKVLQAHQENKARVVLKQYDSNLNGVALATRTPQLKKDLIEFFDKNLMKYDVPWQDRRSRLSR